MNKAELVNVVKNATGMTEKQTNEAVTAVFDAMKNALVEGDTVQMVGFGSFSVKERAAREGRNPSTGEIMAIPATLAVSFKVSSALKDAVNHK